MGLLSALNPLAFGRKSRAAWNALMASYTFLHLNTPQQHLVLGRARQIAEEQFDRPIEEVLKRNGRIVFLNFLVYGLGEEGIPPALGGDSWFWLKNPFVECIGAEDVIEALKQRLEKQHGVQFNIDF